MELKDILKQKRNELNLTLEEIGNAVGVSKTTVQRWESGEIKNLRRDKISKLAQILKISPSLLLGDYIEEPFNTADYLISKYDNIIPVPSGKKVPIIGSIACGTPILATENIEGYIETDGNAHIDFALVCKGDSMAPRLIDGDIVLIKQQPTADNGQLAAVLIDEEATLKRVFFSGDNLILNPENHNYAPLTYSGSEKENIRILGIVKGYIRYF